MRKEKKTTLRFVKERMRWQKEDQLFCMMKAFTEHSTCNVEVRIFFSCIH